MRVSRSRCAYAFLLVVLAVLGLLYFNLRESLDQPTYTAFRSLRNHMVLPNDINGVLTGFMDYINETKYIKLEGVDSSEHDIFVVYGGSIDQLKRVCSALEDCEGFNSEGWIKSHVGNKHKMSSIDLYIKHRLIRESVRTTPDTDAGVFKFNLGDYDIMERNLRIYIYNTDIGQNMLSYPDYKYGVEYLFISLLENSNFRTNDPQDAMFYFIPARCTAYRKSVHDLTEGIGKAADTMKEMVEYIKYNYPYWNQSLGVDHFYVCAHDMGTDIVKRSDPYLWKNSIGLVNTADSSEPMFVPHKDISLPPHPGRGSIDLAVIGQGGVTFKPRLRSKLAFVAGHPGRGPVRPLLYELFQDDPDFHMVKGYMSDENYIHALKTTKFCLCPRGNKVWSPRLMDAIWFGCIPVVIADHYILPLSFLIDWSNIAVIVKEDEITKLKEILLSISDVRLVQMQTTIQAVHKHLTWNDPPRPYDAFHSVLFELWYKRNVRRK